MKPIRIALFLCLASVFGRSGRAAESITVFAAASLTESLKEIGAAFERQTGNKVVFNFAGSGPLRRQIEEGAPADLFFSADEATMSALESKDLILPGTRQSRLSNRLVVVAPGDGSLQLGSARDLASAAIKRLAVGDPKTVPAGTYAREYLTKLGVWAELEPRLVPCENVRAVLAAVESGNVDAGIVYRTDAGISRSVKVLWEVPVKEGPRISYPVAVVKGAPHLVAARRLLGYLTGSEAGQVFERRGFVVLTSETEK